MARSANLVTVAIVLFCFAYPGPESMFSRVHLADSVGFRVHELTNQTAVFSTKTYRVKLSL